MDVIKGGFALSANDERLLNQQRAITANVNNNFIQVGATFLNMSSKTPMAADWYKRKFRDTNLQEWIDNPDYRALNVGFNLQFGWLDVDIDSGDPLYNASIVAAMKFLQVDTRFAFGRQSKNVPSHLLVQLAESDITNYDMMKEFEPKEFKIGGHRFKTELRSMGPANEQIKQARQTVVPGSIYASKNEPGKYDISVWYSGAGNVAMNTHDLATTTPRKTTFSVLITGIAFGTFLYVIQPHWTEGTRQNTAIKIAGWLARLITESRGINENDGVAQGVFCPCDRLEVAEKMLEFLCAEMNDSEAYMRKRALQDALRKLENNPDAHIPGWPALEGEIGTEAIMALRTVFMPGIDVSPLTAMADRYVYDDSDDVYIDRERFGQRLQFTYDGAQLERRHENEFLDVAGKKKLLFKIYRTSALRKHVNGRGLYPDLPPGVVFRLSPYSEVIPDDDTSPNAVSLFNTWNGWPIPPIESPDSALLAKCNSMMDQLFSYLTQDDAAQSEWLKQWIAWTVQHPGIKQQIAPVIVGGQGVGKSFFGGTFLNALFKTLWGQASPKMLEGNFSIEPFVGKMFVFIDEAKFYHESSTDEIKKIIRNDQIGGTEKFRSAATYNIFARVVFASNRFDMNIGQQNIQDRALFHTKAYDKEFLNMSEPGFRRWAETIKPFFQEYSTLLKQIDVLKHYMYIFHTLPVEQAAIESTYLSSSSDSHIVESNMSYPRRVAKRLIEEGRVWEDLDISAPFPLSEFEKRVIDLCQQTGMRNVRPLAVLNEFKDNGLTEVIMINGQKFWRFKYKIATLTEMYGDAISLPLDTRWEFDEDDRGLNESDLEHAKPWKGRNVRFRNGI